MALVNNFLVGADPELVLLQPPHLVKVDHGRNPFFGFDHNNWVLEPHPAPDASVRQVCKNLRNCLDYMDYHFGSKYRFRAGAYLSTPERSVSLGGHVHLDLPDLSPKQVKAMDYIKQSFEALDILPATECASRYQQGGYGACGDVRREHGRVEYRALCSWLFSARTALLAMTAIKLAAVAPQHVKQFESILEVGNFFELFKGKDDDVDWILEKGYFGKSLEAKPDRSVTEAWRTNVQRGKELAEGLTQKAAESRVAELRRVVAPAPTTSLPWYNEALTSNSLPAVAHALDTARARLHSMTTPSGRAIWGSRVSRLQDRLASIR